jgi:hypothetical protein
MSQVDALTSFFRKFYFNIIFPSIYSYPKGRHQVEDLVVDGTIILKYILGKQGGNVWTGCIWLRIGTSGGLL